jgi:phosphoribosyl 1,2-cyclic phosphate phosphodiesterase
LKITFLGTGTSQGVPVIGCECDVCMSLDFQDKRLRSSIHVEWDGVSIVVDTGPDFRQQMLSNRIKRLDAVLFTHEHKDHTAGLDDIRSYNFMQQIDMPIYARQPVLDQLKREFAYIFAASKYPGVPMVDLHPIVNEPFTVNGLEIIPIEVMHHKMSVFGFRFGDFTYITDANSISDEEMNKIKGSKIVVLNALQLTHHISHFTLDESLAIIEELKPEKAYLTHISHKLGQHRVIRDRLPKNVELAWDGLQVELN